MPFSNDSVLPPPPPQQPDVVSLHQGGARRTLRPRPRIRRHVLARKKSAKHPLRLAVVVVVVRAPHVPHIVVTPPPSPSPSPPPAEEVPACNRAPVPQDAAFGMLLTVPDPECRVVNPVSASDDADAESDIGHTWSG